MRRTAIGAAALTAAVVGSALPIGLSAAQANHPNTVCSHWSTAGESSHHVQVDWMAGRSFRVSITDLTLHAVESEAGDAFVQLPLDPSLRLGTNTVTVGEGLEISDVSISQGIVGGSGAGADAHSPIENYRKLPSAPWESASVSGSTIEWLHDVDALSHADGTQIHPSESPASARAADSAGVLDFTVTVPDSVGGEVPLIAAMTSDVTTGVLSAATEQWVPGQVLARVVEGCTVSVEPVGSPDPEPTPEPEVREREQPASSADKPNHNSAKKSREKAPQAQTPEQRTGTDKPEPREPSERGAKSPDTTSSSPSGEAVQRDGSGGNGSAAVASTGGLSAAPWIAGAGALAALGLALTVAARRSARAKRAHADNAA